MQQAASTVYTPSAAREHAAVQPLWQAAAWLAMVLGGLVVGMAVVRVSLPLATALAVMALGGFVVAGIVGLRWLPLFGIALTIPLPFSKHLTYHAGYIGIADGVTIELVDFCIVWLLLHLVYLYKTDQLKRVSRFATLCLPAIAILIADLISFNRTGDAALSMAGFISDARSAVLFALLVVTLCQGPDALRAMMTGLMWSVIVIGGICVFEMATGFNFTGRTEFGDWEEEFAFRAGGLFSSPPSTAGYLGSLIAPMMVEVFRANTFARRCLACLALALGFAGLFATLTRAAIGFSALTALPLIFILFQKRILGMRHAVAALVGAAILAAVVGNGMASRIEEGTENATARAGLVGTALNMIEDSPVTGQGVNNYVLKMDEFAPKRQTQKWEYMVHNKYLLVAAESGALGTLALVWWLATTLTQGVRNLLRRPTLFAVGVFCSFVFIVLHMNMEAYAGGYMMRNAWMIAACITALSATSEDIAPDPVPQPGRAIRGKALA